MSIRCFCPGATHPCSFTNLITNQILQQIHQNLLDQFVQVIGRCDAGEFLVQHFFFSVNVERLADQHSCMYFVFMAGLLHRHELQRNPPAVSMCPQSSCPNISARIQHSCYHMCPHVLVATAFSMSPQSSCPIYLPAFSIAVLLYVSSFATITCVLIRYYYMCPHTPIYLSSQLLLCICPLAKKIKATIHRWNRIVPVGCSPWTGRCGGSPQILRQSTISPQIN